LWNVVDLADVDVDQSDPKQEYLRRQLLYHVVQLENTETVHSFLVRDPLHHHQVLERDAGGLKKDELKF
jgi:hypothetical protein